MFHVSWTVTNDMIDVELRGVAEPGSYLAFGPSGSDARTSMIGADVVVGWIDRASNEGMVEDYHLTSYEQVCMRLFSCLPPSLPPLLPSSLPSLHL